MNAAADPCPVPAIADETSQQTRRKEEKEGQSCEGCGLLRHEATVSQAIEGVTVRCKEQQCRPGQDRYREG